MTTEKRPSMLPIALLLALMAGVMAVRGQVTNMQVTSPGLPVQITPASAVNGAGVSSVALTSAGLTTTGTGDVNVSSARFLGFLSRAYFSSTADKRMLVIDNAGATGMELNVGTPTLGTCVGGSLTSGSHNFGGEVTGNTSGSCIINFGVPNFTNAPFCMTNDETSSIIAPNVSARSASSITIAGQASGNAIQWLCFGPIGT